MRVGGQVQEKKRPTRVKVRMKFDRIRKEARIEME
jgi:hypothetical protein